MSELDLFAAARPDVPLADPGELAPARAKLIAGIAEAAATSPLPAAAPPAPAPRRGHHLPTPSSPAPRRGRWRPVWAKPAGVAAVAAVAAAVVALLVVPAHVVPGHGGPPGGTRRSARGLTSAP